MPLLYLVRHAKPSASWGEDPDPGLDEVGVGQARIAADAIAARITPISLLTSPMRRCIETATALEQRWHSGAEVFSPVAEIPSPPLSLVARHKWLATAMTGTWRQLQMNAPPGSPDFLSWRASMLQAVLSLRHSAVIFSHYIAINAVVGAARGSDDVVCFRPDHASVTIVEADGNDLHVVELGREAVTSVLPRA